ncbi:hypothetical protein M0R04_05575 [Candidatus Dojkabacteria bacterium]|jgi:hypothetical protein|nr:hypothetical protein [Candidatus Dojkabacteria bacterium]
MEQSNLYFYASGSLVKEGDIVLYVRDFNSSVYPLTKFSTLLNQVYFSIASIHSLKDGVWIVYANSYLPYKIASYAAKSNSFRNIVDNSVFLIGRKEEMDRVRFSYLEKPIFKCDYEISEVAIKAWKEATPNGG